MLSMLENLCADFVQMENLYWGICSSCQKCGRFVNLGKNTMGDFFSYIWNIMLLTSVFYSIVAFYEKVTLLWRDKIPHVFWQGGQNLQYKFAYVDKIPHIFLTGWKESPLYFASLDQILHITCILSTSSEFTIFIYKKLWHNFTQNTYIIVFMQVVRFLIITFMINLDSNLNKPSF